MTDATRLRATLIALGLSQRGAARLLGLDERTVRRWCAGDSPVPTVVWLALDALKPRGVTVRVEIPDGLRFANLKLTRDPVTGEIEFDVKPLRKIAAASGLAASFFDDENNVSALIAAWYRDARAAGEPADPVQEDLIAEAAAEDAAGSASYPPGRG